MASQTFPIFSNTKLFRPTLIIFARSTNVVGPFVRNHVYEILGGQKFHPRTSYPKVLAFEPVYLLSDSTFHHFTILYARQYVNDGLLIKFCFSWSPSGAYIWIYSLNFDPVSSFNRLHYCPYFL
jgi:hypothetical protein